MLRYQMIGYIYKRLWQFTIIVSHNIILCMYIVLLIIVYLLFYIIIQSQSIAKKTIGSYVTPSPFNNKHFNQSNFSTQTSLLKFLLQKSDGILYPKTPEFSYIDQYPVIFYDYLGCGITGYFFRFYLKILVNIPKIGNHKGKLWVRILYNHHIRYLF